MKATKRANPLGDSLILNYRNYKNNFFSNKEGPNYTSIKYIYPKKKI